MSCMCHGTPYKVFQDHMLHYNYVLNSPRKPFVVRMRKRQVTNSIMCLMGIPKPYNYMPKLTICQFVLHIFTLLRFRFISVYPFVLTLPPRFAIKAKKKKKKKKGIYGSVFLCVCVCVFTYVRVCRLLQLLKDEV